MWTYFAEVSQWRISPFLKWEYKCICVYNVNSSKIEEKGGSRGDICLKGPIKIFLHTALTGTELRVIALIFTTRKTTNLGRWEHSEGHRQISSPGTEAAEVTNPWEQWSGNCDGVWDAQWALEQERDTLRGCSRRGASMLLSVRSPRIPLSSHPRESRKSPQVPDRDRGQVTLSVYSAKQRGIDLTWALF